MAIGYCSVANIRSLTALTTTDVSDADVTTLIGFASEQLNADMNVEEFEEKIEYIDETKENLIDGSNTTFYTKFFPIGDYDNSFVVDTSDIEVSQVASDGTKTTLTVSTLTAKTGAFTLSAAPAASVKLLVTYVHVKRRVDTIHPLVRTASAILTAAYCYSKTIIGKPGHFRLGNFTLFRDTEAYNKYYAQYVKLLTEINDQSIANIREAENLI